MEEGNKDKRSGARVNAALPVALEGLAGRARDLSAHGIFIETDTPYAVGSPVSVTLDLDTPWGTVVIRSQGKIVRVERCAGKIGVAVQFLQEAAATAR